MRVALLSVLMVYAGSSLAADDWLEGKWHSNVDISTEHLLQNHPHARDATEAIRSLYGRTSWVVADGVLTVIDTESDKRHSFPFSILSSSTSFLEILLYDSEDENQTSFKIERFTEHICARSSTYWASSNMQPRESVFIECFTREGA